MVRDIVEAQELRGLQHDIAQLAEGCDVGVLVITQHKLRLANVATNVALPLASLQQAVHDV